LQGGEEAHGSGGFSIVHPGGRHKDPGRDRILQIHFRPVGLFENRICHFKNQYFLKTSGCKQNAVEGS
jgi:hypothetical protein